MLISIIAISGIYLVFNHSNQKEEIIISAYDEIFQEQKQIDEQIIKDRKNKEYTMQQPKVMLNPYQLAPLTALVIFQTPEEVSIEVKVNHNLMTNIEKSKEHVIPIYGMYANHKNEIELIASNGERKEINIKTEPYEGDPITVEKTNEEVKNNLYFISPNFVNNCIINGNGDVLWYIKRGLCRRYRISRKWALLY